MKGPLTKSITFGLLFCMGMCFAKEIKSPAVAVNETVTVTFKAIKDPLDSVKYKGKYYGPTDSNANTMAEVVFKVANNGTEVLKDLNQLKNIELVCADKAGALSLSSWDILFQEEYKGGATQEDFNRNYFRIEEYNIEPNTTFEKKVYFVHPKKLTPVAFTQGRMVVCTLYDEKAKNAAVIAKNLVGIEKTTECLEMIKSSSSEEVWKFMNEYGITFDAEDANGFPLLYYAINYGNNAFLDLAIERKADLKHRVPFETAYLKLTPIQFAVLCGNGYAVDALIAAGEDLFFTDVKLGVTDVGSMVVQHNGLPGARILVAHGFDFSKLTIGGGWTKKQTAVEYAESNGYVELAEYLKSVTRPQGAQ